MSNDVVNAILNLQKVLLMHGGNRLNIQVDRQTYLKFTEDLYLMYGVDQKEEQLSLVLNGPMCATKITVTDV